MTCSFSCPGNNYNGSAPSGECVAKCNGCLTGCYLCNDVNGSTCQAGNGYICEQTH